MIGGDRPAGVKPQRDPSSGPEAVIDLEADPVAQLVGPLDDHPLPVRPGTRWRRRPAGPARNGAPTRGPWGPPPVPRTRDGSRPVGEWRRPRARRRRWSRPTPGAPDWPRWWPPPGGAALAGRVPPPRRRRSRSPPAPGAGGPRPAGGEVARSPTRCPRQGRRRPSSRDGPRLGSGVVVGADGEGEPAGTLGGRRASPVRGSPAAHGRRCSSRRPGPRGRGWARTAPSRRWRSTPRARRGRAFPSRGRGSGPRHRRRRA